VCVCRQGAVKGSDTAAEQRYPVPGSLPPAVHQHGQRHQVCQAAGKSSIVFCISKPFCHPAAVYQHGQLCQVCQAACESSVSFSRPKPVCHILEKGEAIQLPHQIIMLLQRDNVYCESPS